MTSGKNRGVTYDFELRDNYLILIDKTSFPLSFLIRLNLLQVPWTLLLKLQNDYVYSKRQTKLNDQEVGREKRGIESYNVTSKERFICE